MSTTWNDSRFGPGSYEHSSQEDRSAPRRRVAIPATLRAAGGGTFETMVRDLSLTGFTASVPGPIPTQTFCWLALPGLEAIQSEVVWSHGGQIGAAFGRIISDTVFEALVARWPADETPDALRSPYA